MIYTCCHSVSHLSVANLYPSRSCFLLCGGPSFALLSQQQRQQLRQPGVLTMAVNNAAASLRPNLWVGVDPPEHFIRSLWLDPTILKFTPAEHADRPIFDSNAWRFTDVTVRQCPAVFFFELAERLDLGAFLTSPAVMWGEPAGAGGERDGIPGGRSVMLAALRVLYDLGVRRVFLLGCDFRMNRDAAYHFDQSRSRASVRGNLHTYAKLSRWLTELRPIFDAAGFHVYNCNHESALKAFDFIDFDEAMDLALAEFGHIDVTTERTAGLYDLPKPRPQAVPAEAGGVA